MDNIEVPSVPAIPENPIVSFPTTVENGGGPNGGNPGTICPNIVLILLKIFQILTAQ